MEITEFNFCNNCKMSDKCCTHIGRSFDLIPPVVTINDLDRIKKHLSPAALSCVKYNKSASGKTYATIKTYESGGCIFHTNKGCAIYKARPFDCMIFPLDIIKINDQFFWIIYDKYCNEQINTDAVLNFAEALYRKQSNTFLEEFALDVRKIHPNLSYRILKIIESSTIVDAEG